MVTQAMLLRMATCRQVMLLTAGGSDVFCMNAGFSETYLRLKNFQMMIGRMTSDFGSDNLSNSNFDSAGKSERATALAWIDVFFWGFAFSCFVLDMVRLETSVLEKIGFGSPRLLRVLASLPFPRFDLVLPSCNK